MKECDICQKQRCVDLPTPDDAFEFAGRMIIIYNGKDPEHQERSSLIIDQCPLKLRHEKDQLRKYILQAQKNNRQNLP